MLFKNTHAISEISISRNQRSSSHLFSGAFPYQFSFSPSRPFAFSLWKI